MRRNQEVSKEAQEEAESYANEAYEHWENDRLSEATYAMLGSIASSLRGIHAELRENLIP